MLLGRWRCTSGVGREKGAEVEGFVGRINKKSAIKGPASEYTIVREHRSWMVQGSNNM